MKTFKVGDYVCVEDWSHGRIVDIEEDWAYVQFETYRGGICLQSKLSKLKYEKWCITTDDLCHNGIVFLGWQNPAWDEDGYFWTSRDAIEKIVDNSTSEHPFLFNSRKSAIKHLKTLNIPQKCRVIKFIF